MSHSTRRLLSAVVSDGQMKPPMEPLSDQHRAAVQDALNSLTGKHVGLDVEVDPAIIGGLVVKLGSRMVDSSLRTKLNSIKHAMKEVG